MERMSRVDMIISMLKGEPQDIFLNYSLGLEYFADLSMQMAEESFKRTLELQNDYVPAYYQLGKLYEVQQKIPEAIAVFKKGLFFAQQQKNSKAVNEFNEAIFMLED